MGKPDYLCIGMQKGGTTWLYDVLKQHPEIVNLPSKELVFFNNFAIPEHSEWPLYHRRRQAYEALRLELQNTKSLERNEDFFSRLQWYSLFSQTEVNIGWYEKLFDFAPPNKIVGDYSPDYIMLPIESIQQIKRMYPDIKAIFSIRNPIDRAWSHLKMIAKNENIELTNIERLLTISNRTDVIRRGQFIEDFQNWKSVFGNDFLFYKFEAIDVEPLTIIKKVCTLLNIGFEEQKFERYSEKVFSGHAAKIPEKIKFHLEEKYGKEQEYFESLPIYSPH
tara:strand:- start:10859 stop:11692 length:834 start_codon:yes stop_codon:yes gene_type:complete